MSHATGLPWDAVSVLFNLPGHRVLEAVDAGDGCPDCGGLSDRVHQRTWPRLRDVAVGGRPGELEVVLVKRRFACVESACPRRPFVQVSVQVPLRARVTT